MAAPSLTNSSISHGNSLSSDLSYTQDLHPDASSKAVSHASNNHQPGMDATANNTLDKKIIIPKYTYDPNDRVAASRWYKDVLSILSASSYYNTLLDSNGNIDLNIGSTIVNHNLYNILYRCIDTKFQKVAHSSHWQLGTDILSFVYNTFSDNSSFLDDAREAHSSLSQLRWNANKESLMDFAEIVADLYAKLKNTEYERIITPTELRRLWILALPLPIFTTIRGKVTTNDILPPHWINATTISSLIAATRKEIASQKAHTTLANMLKKGTQQPADTNKTNAGDSSKTGTKPGNPDKTTTQDKYGNQDNFQRYPFQSDFTSMFDTMRAIEHDIFQGLSLDAIHSKYPVSQDPNTCILCRYKSNQKRYHHTRDCQDIKKTQESYNNANSNNNTNVTVYFISPPCSRLIQSSPHNSNQLCHDTGTPLHLFNDATYFSTITYFPATSRPSVALGDETTLIPILGYGVADFTLQTHRIRIKAYLVPSLGTNLFSPAQHIKYQSCTYTLSHNTMMVHFPGFSLQLKASDHFTCPITPVHNFNQPIAFDATQATLSTEADLNVKLQRLHPLAFMPFRATPGSVGYDLTSFQPISIQPHSVVKIPLGFALEMPHTYRCQIASRSSLASKGIVVLGGIIDNDYRGDITVILSNTTNQQFTLPANSKIAQLLFIPTALPTIVETDQPLTSTLRNTNGFGSTNTIPSRRINRTLSSLPTIHEDITNDTTTTSTPEQAPTGCIKKHPRPSVHSSNSLQTHVTNPPPRLRQTTLDLFLKLQHQTPSASPSLHPRDRVPSSVPALVSMTSEMFQKCTGFRNIHKIMKLIKEHAAPTIDIQDLGRDPFLSRGEVATLPKSRRNTSPIPRPDVFGSIIHYDIGFGAGMSIGGFTHVLFLVDSATRKKFIYGLKNLHESSIRTVMQDFIKDLGCYPSKMLADRDFKIIGDNVKELFRPNTFEHGTDLNFTGTHVAGAPQGRQNQNGLSEGNWKYVCNMARNFLTENLLPRQFWFHALKYAVHVSNYLPVKLTNGQVSTPHELAHGTSPDYRKLIPIFSVGYTKVDTATATTNNNLVTSQTTPTILIGLDDQSDGYLFYNPSTKSIISSSDFRLDHSRPSGPLFNLPHESGNFGFSLYDPQQQHTQHLPPFSLGDKVFITDATNENASIPATVLSIPLSDNLPYTVQLENGQVKEEYLSSLSLHSPTSSPHTSTSNTTNIQQQYPWLAHGAKVTLFFTNKMTTPKQGFLHKSNTDQWSFIPGRSALRNNRNRPIPLPNFIDVAPSLIRQHLLTPNWLTSKTFLEQYNLASAKTTLARRVILTGSADPEHLTDTHIHQQLANNPAHAIATIFKISAAELQSQTEPKLHEHYKLSPKDKQIWDESYREEYFGLHDDTQTWQYITEDEYQNLKSVLGRPLPTMAISKIKRDSQGNPTRAKYRIVVLGNLDPHQWSKADCFAPVLSALELRLLLAVATNLRVIPKQCDAIQAFCQTTLPPGEQYVCTPPKGCPFTPPNTYLLLKKTLYGLKRSPRHWYETAKKALQQLNLQPCPNAPCIFTGTLLPNKPPIYVGIYVDDFIYFSTDSDVEKAFETMLPTKTSLQVEFNGPIHHFLGIKFTHQQSHDGHVTLHLSQEADVHQLLEDNNLHTPTTIIKPTPYRSGHPVDTVPNINMPISARIELESKLRKILGSLNWLTTQTRPDIATITNIIAHYQSNPSPGHLEAAKYVLRYLKGTANFGITFSSRVNSPLESFVKFPISPTKLHPFSDSNWGPQDASAPKPDDPPVELELFKSRSISGFVIWLGGPLHWVSKRQSITARSSTEAEIYAVDECTKCLQHISNILQDLNLLHIFTENQPIPIQNDNEAAVKWSHNMTTKGLRHIQMRENAVREQIQLGFITVEHIGGKQNLADAFTKEEKDTNHFITCRDLLVSKAPDNPSVSNPLNNIDSSDNNSHNAVFKINPVNNSLRDARDVTATSSLSCLPRQARGVLSPVRRTLGPMLWSSARHLSSRSF
jgi:deoxyuridine 5'-triphosphate nucleotidohydrolase